MKAIDAVPIIVRMLRACDVKFEESKHPRGQPKNAGQFAEKGSGKPSGRTSKNLRGQPVPVYTREDLGKMGAARRDATLHQISPSSGKPAENIFFFDPGNGDLRPSVLVGESNREKLSAPLSAQSGNVIRETLKTHGIDLPTDEEEELQDILGNIEKATGAGVVEMKQAFSKMPESVGRVELSVASATSTTIKFRVHGRTKDLGQTFTCTWLVSNEDGKKTAHMKLFQVHDKMQGQGLAKMFMKNSLDYYTKAEVQELSLEADIDVGGYAWARYGFIPKSAAAWAHVRRNVKMLVDRGVVKLKPGEGASVKAILADKSPKAIRALAALPSGFQLLKGREETGGAGWEGTLDLTDPKTRRIVYAYCG
jgi:hypothetical protein